MMRPNKIRNGSIHLDNESMSENHIFLGKSRTLNYFANKGLKETYK